MFDVKKYYFVAHKAEARVYIQNLELLQTQNSAIYTNHDTVLTITSMGKNCVEKLKETFLLYPPLHSARVINIGIAGCRDQDTPIGSVFAVGRVCFKKSYIEINGGVTCHSFESIQDDDFEGFLCDMESYFLVKEVTKYLSKENIKLFKVVSDHLHDAKIPSKKQLNEWMQRVYDYEMHSLQ